ncbi:hypothetical protein N0V90_007844 [Kalmusia sp. IMI 367209]|nr:hypothetical protein N0V90_007844 [Kalmusia sp. IMI 367209]
MEADPSSDFDPNKVNLTSPDFDLRQVICYINGEGNEYDGHLAARISSIFVIFAVSTVVTFFPVVAKRMPKLRIPTTAYQFARFFGAGVIIATAFVHLLDPAYDEIGPASCVGLTGGWTEYSFVPAIVLAAIFTIFIVDLSTERYVELKYGISVDAKVEDLITSGRTALVKDAPNSHKRKAPHDMERISFHQQLAAFLILEFGIIFHSVIIGLNLGVVGEEFNTLYPVLVFHQSFEGLGIGARLSGIEFPRRYKWIPYLLCLAYGLTTPISIAIGLGVRTTYNPGSFTANVVSGVLDSISAGILIYTGMVEFFARDFLFDPKSTRDGKSLVFKVVCLALGIGIMALLGKWA